MVLALVFVVITVIVAIIGLAKGQLPAPSFVPDLSYTAGAVAIFTVIPVRRLGLVYLAEQRAAQP